MTDNRYGDLKFAKLSNPMVADHAAIGSFDFPRNGRLQFDALLQGA
jgi:hypothetical protein